MYPNCIDNISEAECHDIFAGHDWVLGGNCADNVCPIPAIGRCGDYPNPMEPMCWSFFYTKRLELPGAFIIDWRDLDQ